jgi:hypothetical protein
MSDEEYLEHVPYSHRRLLEEKYTNCVTGETDWDALMREAEAGVNAAKGGNPW